MSLHPSLRIDTAGAQQRTVLTRIERIKDLMKKDLWEDGRSVTGLPKTKIVKIKTAAKEKKEEASEEGEATVEVTKATKGAKEEPKK
jgi:small basic protein (TIGR04137 family)